MKSIRAGIAVAALAVGLLVGTSASAGAANLGNVTCNGGTVAAGVYQSLTINGFCSMPDAPSVVEIHGVLKINANAAFDAGEPGSGRLWVQNNVTVGTNAILNLGCGGPDGGGGDTVAAAGTTPDDCTAHYLNGGLYGTNALAVIVHGISMRGDFVLNGSGNQTGGGAGSDSCLSGVLFGGPAFSNLEDSNVNGFVSVSNLSTCWFGIFRNNVRGNITIQNNSFDDPDANEVANNVSNNRIDCSNNTPAAQFGDSGGGSNQARGGLHGECAAL